MSGERIERINERGLYGDYEARSEEKAYAKWHTPKHKCTTQSSCRQVVRGREDRGGNGGIVIAASISML